MVKNNPLTIKPDSMLAPNSIPQLSPNPSMFQISPNLISLNASQ
jgi:hypothetical protein